MNRAGLVIFALVALVIAGWLGEGYIGRLSNHAGYFLVPVEDRIDAPPPSGRPARAFVIVVDGLRREAAETMDVIRRFEAAGQCRVSDQGSYTVSRPVYALLSAGVEVDRSGARNNERTTPLAVESIWEVAREGGLSVSGASHLPWFQELFPRGFDRYRHALLHDENVFASRDGDLDLNLFHPLYVDEVGHASGAASVAYREAVARADREIGELLARVDLTRDLVVLTADHGHRDSGGHGGAQPEVARVLACFAGPNVARRTDRAPLDGRATPAALALLLGLRFPRHLRAGDDGLDAIFEILRSTPEDEAYLADRRAAVARFREANRRALEGWLGEGPGSWSRLHAREARAQWARAGGVLLLGITAAGIFARRRRLDRHAILRRVCWLVLTVCLVWGIHHVVLGELDYSVINRRAIFIRRAAAIAVAATALGVAAHRRLVGGELAPDLGALLALGLFAITGHVVVYGWPVGFPLPPPVARYFPFFGAIVVGVVAVFTLAAALLRSARAGAPSPPGGSTESLPLPRETGGSPSTARRH